MLAAANLRFMAVFPSLFTPAMHAPPMREKSTVDAIEALNRNQVEELEDMKKIAHFKIARRRAPRAISVESYQPGSSPSTPIKIAHEKAAPNSGPNTSQSWSFMIIDKLVIALIVALVTSITTYYFQKKNVEYTTASALRQADLGEIKRAFNDVWPKLYAYEAAVDELGGAARALAMHKDVFPESLPKYQVDFEKRKVEESKAFQIACDALKAQQHVLGIDMMTRSEWYLRHTRNMALIYEDSKLTEGSDLEREIYQNAIEASRKIRAQLRTSLTDLNGFYCCR